MERNDSFGTGSQGQGSGSTGGYGSTSGGSGSGSGSTGGTGATGGAGYGGSSYGAGSTGGSTSSGTSGGTADGQSRMQQGREAVTDAVSNVRDRASDVASTAKDKASNLKSTLADKLEAGAERLRSGRGQQFAGAGGATVGTDDRVQQLGGKAADALQSTADFLRDGDLKATIEQQVKEHPGRTLLIALGLGYVLGKAFRR